MDLVRTGKLPQKGFLSQEQIDLDEFLDNRFGGMFLGKPLTTAAKTDKAA